MIFNHKKFANAVKSIHLKPEEISTYELIPDSEVRKRLDKFVDYDANPRFSAALDEICENIVGRTMFKILMTKMIACNIVERKGKIRILQYADDGSRYSPQSRDFAVKINSDFYELDGTGISERRYYGITEEGEVKTKQKSMTGSIFHEFCHGLHDVSDTYIRERKNTICLDKTVLKNVWTTDEELRTICCLSLTGTAHDPICDHCFDFCQSVSKKQPFCPRYTHGGWDGSDDAVVRRYLLKYLPQSQIYMDGWREYMI